MNHRDVGGGVIRELADETSVLNRLLLVHRALDGDAFRVDNHHALDAAMRADPVECVLDGCRHF